jgi:hypothetical protein
MLKTLQLGKNKPYLTTDQYRAARRVGDLTRIYRDQYPNGLPHNDVGVSYSKYICRTMAFLPKDRRARWLDRYAPWMDAEIRGGILDLGPYWYSSHSLGNRLEIDNEDRERLEAWTIEAYDISKEQRKVLTVEKRRKTEERRRRKAGAKPRAESEMRTKPWVEQNISRRTYYRKKKLGTGSWPPSLNIRQGHETVSLSEPQVAAITPATPSQPNRPAPAASNVIVFPRPKKTKPSLKLVWSVPTPERIAHMRGLQGGYACAAVEDPATADAEPQAPLTFRWQRLQADPLPLAA